MRAAGGDPVLTWEVQSATPAPVAVQFDTEIEPIQQRIENFLIDHVL